MVRRWGAGLMVRGWGGAVRACWGAGKGEPARVRGWEESAGEEETVKSVTCEAGKGAL